MARPQGKVLFRADFSSMIICGQKFEKWYLIKKLTENKILTIHLSIFFKNIQGLMQVLVMTQRMTHYHLRDDDEFWQIVQFSASPVSYWMYQIKKFIILNKKFKTWRCTSSRVESGNFNDFYYNFITIVAGNSFAV